MARKAEARQSVQDVRLRVVLPVVAFTLAAVFLTVSGLYWVTTRSDAISVDRQIREMRNAFSASLDELVRAQEVVAIWDEVVLELRKDEPDWSWVDQNMSFWLYRLFRHDQFYLLGGDDQPIYASEGETRLPKASYSAVQPVIHRLVERVRGRTDASSNPHERLPGKPLHPESTVFTGSNAIHATEFVNLLG